MAETAVPANITGTAAVNASMGNRRGIAEFAATQKTGEEISRKPMIRNIAMPPIEVGLEIYEPRADGQPLTRAFAKVPAPAQRHFIF